MPEVVPSWSPSSLGAAVNAVLDLPWDGTGPGPDEDVVAYVRALAHDAGLVAENVAFGWHDLPQLAERERPLLLVTTPREDKLFVVLRAHGGKAELLAPSGDRVTVGTEAMLSAVTEGVRQRVAKVAEVLGAGGTENRDELDLALRNEVGRELSVGWGFTFRERTPDTLPAMLGAMRLAPAALRLVAYLGLESALTAVAWAVIGSLALSGRTDRSSLLGWALLSVAAMLVQTAATRFVGRFTVHAATMIRQRLLEGALRLDPRELSAFGFGGLVVMASQADAFLSSTVSLVISCLTAATNLVVAIGVLAAAPLPFVSLGVFAAFGLAIVGLTPLLARRATAQQGERVRLTTRLVEAMLGHRTRLAQQTVNSWHEGEDEALHAYGSSSADYDRKLVLVRALSRAYYAAALGVVFFVLVAKPTQEALALSLGGMMLAMVSLRALGELAVSAAETHAMWHAIQPVIRESAASRPTTLPLLRSAARERDGSHPIVELRRVGFSYEDRRRQVFSDVSLGIGRGERVLVEGPSGGGKTTLASLVTGLTKPTSGLLLVEGIDQHTLGERELRRVVASAPQFYKNHVFSDTLAFNLLLGRAWPPSPADIALAYETAEALGLGPLLERMPAGLEQQVGESGWQLSHGERSRVFLGRSLLQRSEVVLLDETFGALDPEAMRVCMNVALERAKTLIVITHR